MAWHPQRREGSVAVLALKWYRRDDWHSVIAAWPGFIHAPQWKYVPRSLQGPFLFDFEEELPIWAAGIRDEWGGRDSIIIGHTEAGPLATWRG